MKPTIIGEMLLNHELESRSKPIYMYNECTPTGNLSSALLCGILDIMPNRYLQIYRMRPVVAHFITGMYHIGV